MKYPVQFPDYRILSAVSFSNVSGKIKSYYLTHIVQHLSDWTGQKNAFLFNKSWPDPFQVFSSLLCLHALPCVNISFVRTLSENCGGKPENLHVQSMHRRELKKSIACLIFIFSVYNVINVQSKIRQASTV
jgi:hypothetical protein